MIYALLHRRTEDIYRSLLQAVKILAPLLHPTHFMCDFEQAMINAVRIEFDPIIVTGCFPHLSQSVYRKIQGLGAV